MDTAATISAAVMLLKILSSFISVSSLRMPSVRRPFPTRSEMRHGGLCRFPPAWYEKQIALSPGSREYRNGATPRRLRSSERCKPFASLLRLYRKAVEDTCAHGVKSPGGYSGAFLF